MMSIKEKFRPQFDELQKMAPRKIFHWQWPQILRVVVLLLCVSVSGVLVQGAFNKATPVKTAAPVPVLTVSVQSASIQPIEHKITVNGSISAWDPISVGAQTSGLEITSILVEEGATVKKGQVLATLDASLIKPQLESAVAELKASLANAKKALQPNRPEDINGLSAAVSQAQANVEDQDAALVQAQANLLNANQNVKRYEFLHTEGAVSLQELESRQTTVTVASANVRSAEQKIKAAKFSLRQAQEHLSMAIIGGRREDIQIADANIDQIRGNIKHIQAQIEQTNIRAPVDGFITKRDAHIGDIAAVGKSMFSMARDSRLELRAQVPETDLAALKSGEIVTIISTLSGNEGIAGRVREISPSIDSDTRLATVRIDIPINAAVKPGMYAEGHIEVGKSAALTVPTQAVLNQDDKYIVFVLHNNKVESRVVTVGTRTNELVEILSGLQPQESVVVNGAGFLKDGDYVAVAK